MKGRGTAENVPNRFHQHSVEIDEYCEAPDVVESVPTTLTAQAVRKIISTNQSPDIHFDQSINPYRGCEHGCVYCYARPTHAFLDLSPGLDFESKLFYKPDAASQLRKELSRPGYTCKVIALGSNTDPYQPSEKKLRLTRAILRTAEEFGQPVSIVTKSTLVTRDADVLQSMAKRGLCKVIVSVTTLNDPLKRQLEPRAASGAQRLATISALRERGIPVGVLIAPIIPKINDEELETIVSECAEAGACSAGYVLIRLPLEVKALFEGWLERHYPQRAEAVMSLIRQNRGGVAYQSAFGSRMTGQGKFAELLANRFRLAIQRHGLADRKFAELNTEGFSVPGIPEQMTLAL